jgi:mannose/cellobiose epimerase-like protein (N-acyl-D-glucosamine 2-epimerase family)/ABC-type transporter Mla MlaB component
MSTPTAFNDPAALSRSRSCHGETIYGEIHTFSAEKRRLTVKTLNEQFLTVVLLPQAWIHQLCNLGQTDAPIHDLSSALLPGRWVMLRCICYSAEKSILIDVQEVILVSRDATHRVAHHPDWWRHQICELADFYLKHLSAGDEQLGADYSCYRTYLQGDGKSIEDGRQETAVLSRLVYGFATAYLLSGQRRYWLAAVQGSDYLIHHFCQRDHEPGLAYWIHGIELNADGGRTLILASEAGDDLSAIACYEQIYALAGIAQTYRITGNPELLAVCQSTIAFLRRYFRDSGPDGGYFSHLDPLYFSPLDDDLGCNRARKNWNSIGDHIPAYLIQLYLATQDSGLRDFLLELQNLLLTKFDPKDGAPFIEERFHANWEPDHGWGWQQNRTVIGHNLKIIWNLLRLHHFNPDSRTISFCKRLIEPVVSHGFDALRGGWYDMVEREYPHHLCWHDHKAWWQQEQGILALQLLQVLEPHEPRWSRLANASIDYYNTFFLDRGNGGVYFSVAADGTPWLVGHEALKGSHSMGGYHAFELCLCASVYGNLLIHQNSLRLYFQVVPDQIPEHRLFLAPDLMPDGSIVVQSLRINGEPWDNVNALDLFVDLPSGASLITVEADLGPANAGFQLQEVVERSADGQACTYLMKGYLCDYFLPVFRHRLEELSDVSELRLDASGLTGACPAGMRYLLLLRQQQRSRCEVKVVNIPEELQLQLSSFLNAAG